MCQNDEYVFARLTCFRGFTLLELIVVMAIVGLSASIAVPRMQLAIERVSADAEQRALLEIVGHIELYAFFQQKNYTLRFEEGSVLNQTNTPIITCDHLWFSKQIITWNGNGFPDAESLDYTFCGQKKTLAFY